MMRVVLAVLAAAALGPAKAQVQKGQLWAVLVAGSNSWRDYRHQADVYHAYQILHCRGVPNQNIIIMHYDNIAYNIDNPTPGVVINRPNGPNVYYGVPKDYVGKDVTPQNFLKVLSGDSAGMKGVGSGKVLGSGENDRVFINLVGHGAPGIFGFPSSYLHVKDFTDVIRRMRRNKQFKDLVVYLEASESASMFLNLPDDIRVYALSAANATQSSYACYLDKSRNTYLGDVFSVKWMEDTDREDVARETLQKQFEIVKKETKTSHVQQWGDLSLSKTNVSDFVGIRQLTPSNYGPFDEMNDPCLHSSVAGPDVAFSIFLRNKNDAGDLSGLDFWANQVKELKKNRTFVEDRMAKIVKGMTDDEALANDMMTDSYHRIHNQICHQQATKAWNDFCFDLALNPHAMRMVHVIVNLCEHGFSASEFFLTAHSVCTHRYVTGIK